MKQVEVFGVRLEMPSNQPIVLLREISGDRYLPIWIGSGEASAISFAQQGVQAARPLTHDLLAAIVNSFGERLQHIEIAQLIDGIFHADLVFESGKRISARPSDAIALALKCESPIYCSDQVLEAAGVAVEEGQDEEAELEAFREFLNQINPEDFS